MTIKHVFVSPKEDDGDETVVRPSNWNADHKLRITQDKLLKGAGSGAEPTEIDPYTHPTTGSCPQAPKAHTAASHSDIASSGANIDDAVAKKHDQAHSLASHSSKAHTELTGVTSDQHHPQSHSAASHSDIASTGANIDDAVGKKHAQAHTLASHSTKAHSELTGVNPSDHHTKYTDAEAKAAAVRSGAIVNGESKAPTHDAVYDVKQTALAATTPAEVDSKILTHKNIVSAHHSPYTHPTTGTCPQAPKSHALNSHSVPTADIPMNSKKITGLAAPVSAADAARKAEVDAVSENINSVSHSSPSRSLDSTYRNTSGKIRLVTVTLDINSGESGSALAYCDASSSPSTFVAKVSMDDDVGNVDYAAFTFIVPPNYYYKVVFGKGEIEEWHEWDLH
ncbi:hypothetical protein ES707_11412 [subsurface metagenome]